GDDVDDATGGAAEFGAVVVAEDFEFFNGVDGRGDEEVAVAAAIEVVFAVDKEEVGVGLRATDGDVGVAIQADAAVDAAVVWRNAGDEVDKLIEIAAVERQIVDLLRSDEGGELGSFSL